MGAIVERRHLYVRDAAMRGANSLNFLRLVLASAVIVSHTAALSGGGAAMPHWIGWLAEWAVNGFFSISGFLIAGSRMSSRFGPYILNRGIRIFPAYWTVLAVVALVFAPASTLYSGEHYSLRSAASYLFNNSMLLTNQWGIDGTLLSVPHPGAWNGSLWTLYYEFWAYLCAGGILSLAFVRRRPGRWIGAALFATLVAQALVHGGRLAITDANWLSAFRLAAFFLAGMALYFIPKLPLTHYLAVAAFLLEIALLWTGKVNLFGQLPFAYLLLWFAARVPVRIGSRNDLSYGMYVYAFPVQQMLALVGAAGGRPWVFALLSVALTVPFAWLSWIWVERPAMRHRLSARLSPEALGPSGVSGAAEVVPVRA